MTGRRLVFAILALSTLGGTGRPSNPSSTATAQAAAHIREPVILREGKTLQSEQSQALRTRERKCMAADVPTGVECRLIVTDLE
jgi:hypothetical protein